MKLLLIGFITLFIPTLSLATAQSAHEPDLTQAQPLLASKQAFTPWQYTVGDFTIAWQGKNLSKAQLSITSTTNTQHVAWQSLAGQSFVLAADAYVKRGTGEKKVLEFSNSVCISHSVDNATFKSNTLLLNGSLSCPKNKNVKFSLVFKAPVAGQLQFDLNVADASIGRTGLIFESEAKERIFGFGEQYSAFDFKGKRVPIYVDEQGLSRGAQPLTSFFDKFGKGIAGEWHSTYAPVPYFITSKNRAMVLENTEFSSIDLRGDSQIVSEVYSNHLVARLFTGNSPLDVIENYTQFSGRMRALPEWVTKGAVLGLQGGTARTLKAVKDLQGENGKISAVWLQDWEGQRDSKRGKRLWWNWELDKKRYPNWDAMVKTLANDDIRVMGYINPYLINVEQKGEPFNRNLYKEALELGFLTKRKNGELITVNQGSFLAYVVDITIPEAKTWMKDVIKDELLGVGLSGWMADFGEGLNWESDLASGEPASAQSERCLRPEMSSRQVSIVVAILPARHARPVEANLPKPFRCEAAAMPSRQLRRQWPKSKTGTAGYPTTIPALRSAPADSEFGPDRLRPRPEVPR